MGSVLCIGLDLAWSPRNSSGGAALRATACGGILAETVTLGSDAEIVDWILAQAGIGPALVGIDAPLWVPNLGGQRPAETELNRAFRRYEAGAHPANRARVAFAGVVRGEALVAALAQHGFEHQCAIQPLRPVRQLIEVFPHPAMVVLFGLKRTLKYKAKPNRDPTFRLAEWGRYQACLRALSHADPWLRGCEDLLSVDVGSLRGRHLKDYEDRIDALMCAYIVLYGWRWGSERCRTFGTMAEGYIYTPDLATHSLFLENPKS